MLIGSSLPGPLACQRRSLEILYGFRASGRPPRCLSIKNAADLPLANPTTMGYKINMCFEFPILDIGGYVALAKEVLADQVEIPAGYTRRLGWGSLSTWIVPPNCCKWWCCR